MHATFHAERIDVEAIGQVDDRPCDVSSASSTAFLRDETPFTAIRSTIDPKPLETVLHYRFYYRLDTATLSRATRPPSNGFVSMIFPRNVATLHSESGVASRNCFEWKRGIRRLPPRLGNALTEGNTFVFAGRCPTVTGNTDVLCTPRTVVQGCRGDGSGSAIVTSLHRGGWNL